MARLMMPSFNPVALREMKSRVRGPRTLALFFGYVGVLAVLIFIVYLRKGANSSYSYGGTLLSGNYGPTRNFETGQDIFLSIFLYLLLMVAVVTPAVCGGLVSKEMEAGTYDLLLVTPVKGRTLVWGKLIGAVGYLFMLILATLPLTCIVFVFGGVGPEDVAAGYAIVMMATIVFSVISLFFSAIFRLTNVAIIFTYFIIALFLLGVPVASSSITASINADTGRPSNNGFRVDPRTDPDFDFPKRLLVLNPFAALGSVLAPNAPYRPSSNEDLQLFPNSRLFWGNPTVYYGTPTYIPNSNSRVRFEEAKLPVLPYGLMLWQGYMLVYAAIAIVFVLLSTGAVKPLPGGIIYAPAKGFSALRKGLSKKNRALPVTAAASVATAKPEKVEKVKAKKSKKDKNASLEPAQVAPVVATPSDATTEATIDVAAVAVTHVAEEKAENAPIEAATEAKTVQNKLDMAAAPVSAVEGAVAAPESSEGSAAPAETAALPVEPSAPVFENAEELKNPLEKTGESYSTPAPASPVAEAKQPPRQREALG